jgi:hypothetical protein
MKCGHVDSKDTYVSIAYPSNEAHNRIEIEEVKHYFFSKIEHQAYLNSTKGNLSVKSVNKEYHPEFSRLSTLNKLILAQYIINSQPAETRAIPTPFVYRYSLDQRKQTQQQIKKKISKELTAALGRKPLYWLTAEYDSSFLTDLVTKKNKTLSHSNGEILLYPDEYRTFIDAMLKVHGKNSDSGTKDKRMRENKIIVTSTPKRASEAVKHGNFYSIFNWVSYTSKHKDDLYYISSELRKSAAATYTRDIK